MMGRTRGTLGLLATIAAVVLLVSVAMAGAGVAADETDTNATSNEPPVAAFEPETDELVLPLDETGVNATFDASETHVPDGEVSTLWWEPDDGTTVRDHDAQDAFTYEYEEPGTYDVTLRVRDADGNEDETTETIVVAEEPVLEHADGNGTEAAPYRLTTVRELQAIAHEPSAHYVLADDIDASETVDWNDGSGFEPIEAFDGEFDGDGHTIANLYLDGGIDVGLFDTIRADGTVENVTVEDVDATGHIYVGGIAATNEGTIANVSVTGTLEATNVGGVATANDGLITDAETDVEIRDASFRAGGLAATNADTIADSVATGTIDPASNVSDVGGAIGYDRGELVANVSTDVAIEMEHADLARAGGLIGTNYEGEVTRSSAAGDVRAGDIAGGLIGSTNDDVSDSSATGDVTGDTRVGGLVGSTVGDATVSRSYALGDVTGHDTVGGLVGDNSGLVTESYAAGAVDATGNGTVGGVVADETDSLVFGETTDVYWDADVSGIDDSVNGTPLSTAELTGEDAADALEGFDFEDTWRTTDSYPIHQWDVQSGDEDEDGQQEDEDEERSVAPIDGTIPQDTTDDGLRNDVDGDGETTHDDVTVFFEHLNSDAVQDNPDAFDFDGNDKIGFGDVITLLQEV